MGDLNWIVVYPPWLDMIDCPLVFTNDVGFKFLYLWQVVSDLRGRLKYIRIYLRIYLYLGI